MSQSTEDHSYRDRPLSIAYGNSCHAKFWPNKTTTWPELCERLQTTVRTTETVQEHRKMSKDDRDKAKDKGGFVGGLLSGNRRFITAVKSRSMLTLDVDHANVGFNKRFVSTRHHAACLYSTHSHTPEKPRYRAIVPLGRDLTPDEHTASHGSAEPSVHLTAIPSRPMSSAERSFRSRWWGEKGIETAENR